MVNKESNCLQILCQCNCGNYAKLGNKFIRGHQRKGKTLSNKSKEQMRLSHLGQISLKKGKTFEELYGIQRAVELKNLCSKGRLGKTSSKKGKTYEELYGEIEAEQLKTRLSKSHLGQKTVLGQHRSQETKDLIGFRNTQRIVSKETKEKHRQFMLKEQNRPEIKEKNRLAAIKQHIEGNFGWPRGESYPEKCFRKYLESKNFIKDLDFFQEYHIGTYFLDFAFTSIKLDIEIDGQQHSTFSAVQHDKIRDAILMNFGWTIIRIPVKRLKEQGRRKKINDSDRFIS